MDLILYPNEILNTQCMSVEVFDDSIKTLVDSMAVTMYVERGVGIAAPQVGIARNILLIDPSSGDRSGDFKTLINPKILWASKETVRLSEGCLSIPGVIASLQRPEWIEVEYQDVLGNFHVDRCGGWVSRIIQHELDHLRGVLMLDRIETASRSVLMRCYPSKFKRKG